MKAFLCFAGFGVMVADFAAVWHGDPRIMADMLKVDALLILALLAGLSLAWVTARQQK